MNNFGSFVVCYVKYSSCFPPFEVRESECTTPIREGCARVVYLFIFKCSVPQHLLMLRFGFCASISKQNPRCEAYSGFVFLGTRR